MARSPYAIGSAVQTTIGELTERIRLDSRAQAGDEMGGQPVTWIPFVTIWAKVTPLPIRSSEQVEGGGLSAVETYIFVIRRRADLQPTMRIVWPIDPNTGADVPSSKLYNMRGLNLTPTRALYMTIEAESGVAL